MSTFMRPFHSFEPHEGNPVRDLAFNIAGGLLLVASTTAKAKLFSRDGELMAEFTQGDPYLRDLRHTKGHTTALTSASWHPYDKPYFLTSSIDGTIRTWHCEKKERQQEVIAIKTKQRQSATTCAAYSHDAKLICGASDDGGIRMWGAKGPFIVPSMHVQAHTTGSFINSLVFSKDGHELLTRSMDDTIKLWDIRKFKEPIASVSGITSYFEESNAIFSPEGICT
jgi:WD repeat-containing protein 70